jgi:hypothetical protein
MKKRALAFAWVFSPPPRFVVGSCVNLFSVQDDEDLGAQVDDEIQSNPRRVSPLGGIRLSGGLRLFVRHARPDPSTRARWTHADDFPWQIKIVDDEFGAERLIGPGGLSLFLYGLLKYLDTTDHLAASWATRSRTPPSASGRRPLSSAVRRRAPAPSRFGQRLAIVQDIAGGLVKGLRLQPRSMSLKRRVFRDLLGRDRFRLPTCAGLDFSNKS